MVQLDEAEVRKVEMLRLRLNWPYSLVIREAVKRGLPELAKVTRCKGRIS